MHFLFAIAALPIALSSPILAGSQTADVFPPTGITIDTARFPVETVVGYAGGTPTGAESFAIQTAPAGRFPKANSAQTPFAPLVAPIALNQTADFQAIQNWGNLSPRRSLPAGTFGLHSTSPLIPDDYDLTQVHLIFRHGSRYPSAGEAPITFANRINAAAANGTFKATGELEFLNSWTYKLGVDILNTYGRKQCYDLGVTSRMAYGHLLNNFTEAGNLPVFRTGSQDRMVETMQTFGYGFFGRKSEEQYSLEIEIEATGVNATESPAGSCAVGYIKDYTGAAVFQGGFYAKAFAATAARIQENITGGFKVTAADINGMIGLCSYETISLGYSKFCNLFTEEEFLDYAYGLDLLFYYGFGPGAGTGAAMGYVEELVARLTKTPITVYDSSTNSTLDGNNITFPLDQAIYADATHDAYVSNILTALNFTAINKYGALPISARPSQQSYVSSKLVPFNTELVVQVMSSNGSEPQIRFLLNDAAIPLDDTYIGCEWNKDGLCAVATVVGALKNRLAEINFSYSCFGNWTKPATALDLNGRI